MNLYEVQKDESVIVKKIDDDGALKSRLFSFGISRGAQVSVVEKSLSKSTLEIRVGSTMVAMRDDEAKKILVEKVGV